MPDNPQVLPFKGSAQGKTEQVARMFNGIAHRYDFLNHFLSLGIDRRWRRRALSLLKAERPALILDVATGTADMAILACRRLGTPLVEGVDIAEGMLARGRQKLRTAGLEQRVRLQVADSEALPFPDAHFDAVMSAFGVRNFEHLEKGLAEMSRVLKPGGKAVVLEFSSPTVFPVKQLYNLYFRYITPFIGKWVSRSGEAYSYLPASVSAFPQGARMTALFEQNGFQSATCTPLTFGICSVYCAVR